jgi:hypothetical protein
VVNPFPIITVCREVQIPNEFMPMDVTESGIIIDVKPEP